MIELFPVIGLFFFWMGSSMVCALWEGAFVGEGEYLVMSKILESEFFVSDSIWGRITGIFSTDLWSGLVDMLTFNYGIFHGDYEFFRWIFLAPITLGWTIILAYNAMKLIRGT